jgi:hypothetical protein
MDNLFFQLDANPFRSFFADAGQHGQPLEISGEDRLADLRNTHPRQHRQGKFWPNAGHGSEDEKQFLLLFFKKTEQGDGILTDIGVDMEEYLSAFFRQPGNSIGGQYHFITDSADIDNSAIGIFGENPSC